MKSILLIRPGAIGDFIVSLPALEHLRGDYTEVWCAEQNRSLARFANRAISITAAGLNRVGLLNDDDVLARLRHFDEIHSWYGTAQPAFRDAVRPLPFRFYEALPAGGAQHVTEFYCAQVGAPFRTPSISMRPRQPENLAILHPFASNPAKHWPMGQFRALGELLERSMTVRWCAGPGEPLPEAIRHDDLFQLAEWIATARVYVGNDSGISHLAAAVGTPTTLIFGPTDPAVWAPLGPHVRIVSASSIESISLEQVCEAVRSLL